MKLYHGTSKELLESILEHGLKATPHEEWGNTVCLMDRLEWATQVAHYFGENGIVVEVDVDQNDVLYHPDYDGTNVAFATLHVPYDIPSSDITNIIETPIQLDKSLQRPAGIQLRTWKSQQSEKDKDFHTKLNTALGLK